MDSPNGTPLNRPLLDALARPAGAYRRGAGRPAGSATTTDQPEAAGAVLPDGTVIDVPLTETRRPEFTAQRPVEKLKAAHHELARMMALGFRDKEIHEVLNYSLPHLNTLRRSPAFQNLLAYYMSQRDAETISMKARIENLAHRGLDRLGEALDNDDAPLSAETLRKITSDLLDRCGHSPIQRTASVSVGMTLDEIRKMKEEVRRGTPEAPQTLDHEPPVGEAGAPNPAPATGGDLPTAARPPLRAVLSLVDEESVG